MDHAKEFAALATEYCVLIEKRKRRSARALLKSVHRLLPKLYSGALELKPTGDGHSGKSRRMSHEEWRDIYQGLQKQLGPLGYYRQIFDPFDASDSPVISSLADDLADVYRDLKDGLTLWQEGSHSIAIDEWQEGFRIHWRWHSSNVIQALGWLEFHHRMARSEDDLDTLLVLQEPAAGRNPTP